MSLAFFMGIFSLVPPVNPNSCCLIRQWWIMGYTDTDLIFRRPSMFAARLIARSCPLDRYLSDVRVYSVLWADLPMSKRDRLISFIHMPI